MLGIVKKFLRGNQGCSMFLVLTQSAYAGTNWAYLPAKSGKLVLLRDREKECVCDRGENKACTDLDFASYSCQQ